MSMRSSAIVSAGILGLPFLWALGIGCRNPTRPEPGGAQNNDCGVASNAVADGGGVLCLRFPNRSRAVVTHVWIDEPGGMEWWPATFPTAIVVPFDKPVAVRTALPDAQTEQRVTVHRENPRAEAVLQLDDLPSVSLFGYRWADLPDDTGLRPTDRIAECESTEPLFEFAQAAGPPGHLYSVLRVDHAGEVYRISASQHVRATCHYVGVIDSARWEAMKSLRDQAAHADIVRTNFGTEHGDYRSGHVIRVFGAPDSSVDGAVIAVAENGSEVRRRAGPATDVIVPWMLQLWRTSPWPSEKSK